MTKKIWSIIILIIIILGLIVPKIYADSSEIVSIPNKEVKAGELAILDINLENINEYTLDKIVIATNIYIEPKVDTKNTTLKESDIEFNAKEQKLTITTTNAGAKTIRVSYTIPPYIASGTTIELTVTAYGYKDKDSELEQAYKKTHKIVVKGEEVDKPSTPDTPNNDTQNTQNQSTPNNNTQNNSNSSQQTNNIAQPSNSTTRNKYN